MSFFKVTVNGKEFEITVDGKNITLNGKPAGADIQEAREGEWSILRDNKTYSVTISDADIAAKTIQLHVNGTAYEAVVKNKFDLLLQQMGMGKESSGATGALKAPMPGKVLKVLAAPGQTVKKGDTLLILEAMKMENVIKSPGEGTVKIIRVQTGDAVEKGEVMMEFE